MIRKHEGLPGGHYALITEADGKNFVLLGIYNADGEVLLSVEHKIEDAIRIVRSLKRAAELNAMVYRSKGV